MQFSGQAKPPVGILYDSDFGNRIGPALALCLLYGLDGKNEARVVSISVSKPNLKAAGLAEVFGRFYAGAVSGNFGATGRNLPVGLASDGGDASDTPMLGVLAKKDAEGKLAFEHGLHSINDTADPVPLLRNALTSQYDQNCLVILNGPATNLARLLALPDSKGWIERKARVLVISGGPFPAAPHVAALRKVLAEWPGAIAFVGDDVGAAVRYPAASIETDFSWSPAHPLVEAYRAAGTMPYDASTAELAGVLYAIREKEKFFGVSAAGTLQVSDDGKVSLTPGAGGRHRQLVPDAAQQEKLLKTYIELVTAKPVPRAPRFRRPVVDAAKPADAKDAKKEAPPEKK